LNHGLAVLWQNIPKALLKDYFVNTNLLTSIYLIGIIPFVFGLYTIYKYLFRKKDKKIYLLISFAIIVGLLMWSRLIELSLALSFIGFVMIFLFTKSYAHLCTILRNKKLRLSFVFLISILIFISSIVPSLILASDKIDQAYTQNEIKALLWIRQNTQKEDVILSTLNEGHLIATIARRKNFIDSNFMFVDNIDQRLTDTYKIYKTASQTQAITLLNKYNIKYIYFSKRAKEKYQINNLSYADNTCFKKMFFNEDASIYKSLCIIEEK